MKAPYLADEAFLVDVAAARAEPHKLHLWWMGQSGFLLLWQGNTLLFDPYLSDSLTNKYANTDKPHTRMTGRVIAPERLDFVQISTSTHMHTDHLDGETLKALWSANPDMRLVVAEANRMETASKLGVPAASLVGLDHGIREQVGAFQFSAVPAAHEEMERDELGRCKYLGFVVQAGPWTIYHSGDTIRYPGMAELLREYEIDLAILPINGRRPERRVQGNLDGAEAAHLASDIGARCAIPCHYDMFEFNTEPPDEFIVTCESLGQPYCVLRNGERWSSTHEDLLASTSAGRLAAA
jgi:L-ascorbate metabolism protein UlaG (beta-lactamase superfamily)